MLKEKKHKSNFIKGLKQAFAVEKPTDYKYTQKDIELLDKVAKKVKKIGLVTPAILFLESIKPLGYVSSQAMVFFRPIVNSIFSCHEYDHFTQLLEHRSSVEELIKRIERKEDQKDES